ncbi:hypothetical protein AB0K48_34385 [Nonomuraea sp. NPDC055795]
MGVTTMVVTGFGSDVVDVPAIRDSARAVAKDPEDIVYSIHYQDHGYELILPSGVDLTAKQKAFLRNWTSAAQAENPNGLRTLIRELRAAGAATPIDQMNIGVALEGRRHQPIRVDAIYPVEIKRTAPYSGVWLHIPPADEGSTLQIMFDFNEHTPQARLAIGATGAT